MITYAVVGRDEGATLELALAQALEAAKPGDRVWFVDSASTDGSAAIARRLGVEVVAAPAGKGRAVGAAIERCVGGPLCLLDADTEASSCNIAAALAAAWRATRADMLVGTFSWRDRPLTITRSIYEPLVDALFPEHSGTPPTVPLSGFRVLDTSFPFGRLPAGYGLEAYLNLHVLGTGGRIASVDLGTYAGPARFRPAMAAEIAAAILDVAETQGRVAAGERHVWDAWLEPILELLAVPQPVGEAAKAARRARLASLAQRPLPATRAASR